MSQLFSIGRVTAGLEPKTSAKQNSYLRFSLAERIGYGNTAHTQYIQVWAWGSMAKQLIDAGVRKGSLIWVSGSLELEEYARQDGVTRDKRLKLKLNEWGFVPAAQQPDWTPEHEKDVPAPDLVDGDRDGLPE